MKVTIQQQLNELTLIKSSLYTAINTACTAHSKPTIPVSEQGNFSYYATHIFANLCSGYQPTPTYSVTAVTNSAVMGSVSGGGNYSEGATVTLTATPNSGYKFVSWTKGGVEKSIASTYTFTASSSTTGEYVANFAVKTWKISVASNDELMGTVNPNGIVNVNDGGTIKLTATVTDANTYKFDGWIKGDDPEYVSKSEIYDVKDVTEDASYTGVFVERTGSFRVEITPSGSGSVTYSYDGGSGTVVSGQVYDVPKDTTVTLQATPASGYTFVDWDGAAQSSDTTIQYIVPEDSTVRFTAKFQSEAPQMVTVLYHKCSQNDPCAETSEFNREYLNENSTLGAISTYLDQNVTEYEQENINLNDSENLTMVDSFTNAVVFLVPQGAEITSAEWVDSQDVTTAFTFEPADQVVDGYGYLFLKGAGEPDDYYNYQGRNYTVYIGLWGSMDVSKMYYKIGLSAQQSE